MRKIAWWACSAALIAAVWAGARVAAPSSVPAITKVWLVLQMDASRLTANVITTASTAGLGLLLAVLAGMLVTIVTGFWRAAGNVLYPVAILLKVCPAVAFIPVLWALLHDTHRVHIGTSMLIAFFPVVVLGIERLQEVPEALVLETETYAPTRSAMFRTVMWPYALDGIAKGVQVAAPLAVVGAMVAEIVAGGGNSGLGLYILSQQNHPENAFAAVVLSTLVGIVFFAVATLPARLLRMVLCLGK